MPYTTDGVPYQSGSATSYDAAVSLAPTRAKKTARYLAALADGPLTDHEAAERIGVPLSSICSIRSSVKAAIVREGARLGPYGKACATWRLK